MLFRSTSLRLSTVSPLLHLAAHTVVLRVLATAWGFPLEVFNRVDLTHLDDCLEWYLASHADVDLTHPLLPLCCLDVGAVELPIDLEIA